MCNFFCTCFFSVIIVSTHTEPNTLMPSQQEEQEEIKRLSSRLENIQEQHRKELKVHEHEICVIENNYKEDIPNCMIL